MIRKIHDDEAVSPDPEEPVLRADVVDPTPDAPQPESQPDSETQAEAEASGEESQQARPASFARLYEEEQRVDGRYRWSVGGARAVCGACGEQIPADQPFYTALVESVEAPGTSAQGDPLEVFERCDYCQNCFSEQSKANGADAAAPAGCFAFWKSVLPPPDKPPTKTVNLASMRSYFDRLVDALGEAEAQGEAEGEQPVATEEGNAPEAEELPEVEPNAVEAQIGESQGGPGDEHLCYLLGLFLVRKRSLRWESLDGDVLSLYCRNSDRRYQLTVPHLPQEALAKSIESFESLFG